MAFRISAVVARCEAKALLSALSFDSIDTQSEMPEETWCAQIQETGWTVVFAFDLDFIVNVQDAVEAFSAQAPAFGLRLNEDVMLCQLTAYERGEIGWSVDWFLGDDGTDAGTFETFGTPPSDFDETRLQADAAHAADPDPYHFFDVPVEMLFARTGFRHDIWYQPDAVDVFRVVAPSARRGGLLSRLSGGRS